MPHTQTSPQTVVAIGIIGLAVTLLTALVIAFFAMPMPLFGIAVAFAVTFAFITGKGSAMMQMQKFDHSVLAANAPSTKA